METPEAKHANRAAESFLKNSLKLTRAKIMSIAGGKETMPVADVLRVLDESASYTVQRLNEFLRDGRTTHF